MKRIHRQRLSLFMSMIMTIFLICQGQALAMQADAATAPPAMTNMPDCPESHPAPPALLNCHGECQHLTGHMAAGSLLHAVDACGAILAWWHPLPTREAGGISVASLRPFDTDSDPPPLLRFQHFRE